MVKLAYNVEMLRMEHEMMILKFAQERGLQLNQIKADLAKLAIETKTKVQLDREHQQREKEAEVSLGRMPRPPKSKAPAQFGRRQ